MESPTLIANRGRASGRFGSKRMLSRFFPRNKDVPANAKMDMDSTIIYPDEAFNTGINFAAKLVGVMDIPRPQTRLEIVAAMRRVRFEHKTKGTGKRKVELRVSVDGVRVCSPSHGHHRLGFGRVEYDKLDNHVAFENDANTILHHPIHRIFYVSHDSQDLNVFSYIARETHSELLRCIVFKANKKSDAMQIVKTIGQAFEVCHQMQRSNPDRSRSRSDSLEASPCKMSRTEPNLHQPSVTSSTQVPRSQTICFTDTFEPTTSTSTITFHDPPHLGNEASLRMRKSVSDMPTVSRGSFNGRPIPLSVSGFPSPNDAVGTALANQCSPIRDRHFRLPVSASENGLPVDPPTRLCSSHSIANQSSSVAQARLEHEQQKSRVAKSQINFLKSQLASETAARIDAQNRIDELLGHNALLLDIIESLMGSNRSPADASRSDRSEVMAVTEIAHLLGLYRNRDSGCVSTAHSSAKSSTSSSGGQPLGSSPDSGIKCSSMYTLPNEEY